jgi:hypothetical protein
MRRASSNITINSTASQSQIFTDRDMIHVSDDAPKGKPPKRAKIFGGSNRGILVTKAPQINPKSATISSAPTTPTSVTQTPIKTPPIIINTNPTETTSLTNTNESSPTSPVGVNGRKNIRFPAEQTLHIRSPPIHVKPDRRKDIKLTNCQEKDGIWTATGQFGRESRHSKRAEITYDKKKFRFIQKDDQGNKHVFEIPVSDIEGNKRIFF